MLLLLLEKHTPHQRHYHKENHHAPKKVPQPAKNLTHIHLMSKRKLSLPKRKLSSQRHSAMRNQVQQWQTKLKNLTSMNLVSGVHKNFRHTQQAQVCLNMNDLLVDTRLSRVKNPAGQIPAQSQNKKGCYHVRNSVFPVQCFCLQYFDQLY